MKGFKFLSKDKIGNLPKTAGVYAFKKEAKLFYIGKAANIRERVKNHFQKSSYRDNLFINQVSKIGYIKTDSEPSTRAKHGAGLAPYRNEVSGTGIEALLLEANLIKKYQPKYNIIWRDDKNYFFVAVTREDFPRILITHQQREKADYIGPFVEGTNLKRALTFLRKVFPYYTTKKHPKSSCLWCNLKLCPGPNPEKKEYQKNIKNLIAVLKGKSKAVLGNLKREMKTASESQNYEKAARIRNQILALERVLSHSKVLEEPGFVSIRRSSNYHEWEETEEKLKKILKAEMKIKRIEAYDVSNIQGKEATGSMITFIEGRPDKNFYRKFKIKLAGKPNDIAMIKEVLHRRFEHPEWPYPDLILIDGGKAQLNAALEVRNQKMKNRKMRVVTLAKKHNELFIERRKKQILLESLPREIFNLILQLRDEAHRFAIAYHKKLRRKVLLGE